MNHLLNNGQPFKVGATVGHAGAYIGSGTQGEVYHATVDGQAVALKWYFPQMATAGQRVILEDLISVPPPDDTFLWPLGLAEADGVRGFGYLMPLRPPRYKGIEDLMMCRVSPSFRALATAGFNLSNSFLNLHARGLCYRDLSFGNIFFDPATGDVLICDNDNVAVNVAGQEAGVLGTPRFMAPEIVRREARPNTDTDLFSLGVLLFYMFMIHHPLEGARETRIHSFDLAAMRSLYGTRPLFIFHPEDASNRPVQGEQDNPLVFWPIYPQFIRDLFVQHFTDGVDDCAARVRESQWRSAMVRLRDAIFYCDNCGAENFYDEAHIKATGGKTGTCWHCKHHLRLPPRMRFEDRHAVMLNRDTQLYPFHLRRGEDVPYDFSEKVAEVTCHPQNPDVWGLTNLSGVPWVVSTPEGEKRAVPPGRSARLVSRTRFNFGGTEAELRL